MTQDRTLHLYDTISSVSVAPILSEIIRINNEDEIKEWEVHEKEQSHYTRQPIHFHINSGGGLMYDANVLLSAMESSKTPIYTYTYGYVMSSALTLFTAGDRRFAGKYSTFMFHDPTEDLGQDKLFTMENRLAETKRLKDMRIKYICSRTKLVKEDFERFKYIDYFMDVYDAQKNGIVHETI